MKLRDFAAGCVIVGGLALASAAYANPGDPLTPVITVAKDRFPIGGYLAGSRTGDFVLVWGTSQGYSAQAYDGSGKPFSAPFPILSSSTAGWSVAMDDVGGLTVAWSYAADISRFFARRFSVTGVPLSAASPVNVLDDVLEQPLGSGCYLGDLGSAAHGAYVVHWDCGTLDLYTDLPVPYPPPGYFRPDVSLYRSFLPDGLPRSLEGLFDSNIVQDLVLTIKYTGPYEYGYIAVAPDGSFVAAWQGVGGVHMRRFDALGIPLGLDTIELPGLNNNQDALLSVALGRPGLLGQAGDHILGWYEFSAQVNVYYQAFDGSGKPIGQKLTFPYRVPFPQLQSSANGNYSIVANDSQGHPTVQFFTEYGVPRTGVIPLPPSIGTYYQVVGDAAGNFTISYPGAVKNPDGSTSYFLYAQRFAGLN